MIRIRWGKVVLFLVAAPAVAIAITFGMGVRSVLGAWAIGTTVGVAWAVALPFVVRA